MSAAPHYPVVEIFESVQGEGIHTGKPVVFVRFGRCNLACPWCDTDFRQFQMLDAEAILAQVAAFTPRAVILTGGEPFIQKRLDFLLTQFTELGYWIGVETNGLRRPPAAWVRQIDHVAVSPKACYATRYADTRMMRRADEVRIVVDGDAGDFCRDMRRRIRAAHYFLSPCERGGVCNVEATIRLLGTLNCGRRSGHWLLSLQTHKLAGLQ